MSSNDAILERLSDKEKLSTSRHGRIYRGVGTLEPLTSSPDRAIPSRSASFSYLFPLSRSASIFPPRVCLPPLRLVTPILSLSRHSFFPLCFLYLRSFLQTDLIPFEQRCVSNGYSIDTLPFAISRSTKRIRNFGFHSFSFVKSKRS